MAKASEMLGPSGDLQATGLRHQMDGQRRPQSRSARLVGARDLVIGRVKLCNREGYRVGNRGMLERRM